MPTFTNKNNKIRKAFSLIELSIVVLIASIMVVGAVSVTTATADKQYIKTSKERIDAIYKALGTYVAINGRLPCPAALNLAKGNVNYGKMNGDAANIASGNCSSPVAGGSVLTPIATNTFYGMVPTQTLGISSDLAEDGYGSKIIYVVYQNLTAIGASGFGASASSSIITIIEKKISGDSTTTSSAAFALMSLGKNKSGGWNASSTTQNTLSIDPNELENQYAAGVGNDNNFVISSETSDIFDDIVFYKTKSQMVMDFNLFNNIQCNGFTQVNVYGANSITWPTASYGQIVSGSTCPVGYQNGNVSPTKRCDAFGIWGPIINPCLQ